MSDIVLIDTSIYLNVLDVPGGNQDRDAVLSDFKNKIENDDCFLLPMATIWETGNHISRLSNGHHRRLYASRMLSEVAKSLKGCSP